MVGFLALRTSTLHEFDRSASRQFVVETAGDAVYADIALFRDSQGTGKFVVQVGDSRGISTKGRADCTPNDGNLLQVFTSFQACFSVINIRYSLS